MMELVDLKVLALQLIKEKFSTYFTNKQLACEIVAFEKEINLREVWFKVIYAEYRRKLQYRLNPILAQFNEKGLIEKYNGKTWKKVKVN